MQPATIGPFQVVRELGRGGMGEVYLARDTRLDRQVAIKALPAHLAQDPDRLARFQREAKMLAMLSHTGIGSIHGLEVADGRTYLVLEFVEGETLAERLARGPLTVDDALDTAKQVAEALEAAHEKGVVHRDLKPANIMITPEGVAKVLDFGLARSEDAPATSSIPTAGFSPDSPTVTRLPPVHSPTIPGVIMGSAGYMSPEQARGKPVDKRSDIFSFGCVLYEMLTGAQPFRGETVADAIGATLHKESDLGLLPPHAPARVRELLSKCLAKDRRNRLHDIGDARIELERAMVEPRERTSAPAAARAWWRSPAVLACAALLAATAGIAAVIAARSPATSHANAKVIRSSLELPKDLVMPLGDRSVAVSPDGTTIALVLGTRSESTPPALYLRDLSRLEFRRIEGTELAVYPFWSPDGRSVGFFSRTQLKRLDIAEGIVRVICDAPAGRGATWSTKGTIVFAPSAAGGLSIVSDAGGTPTPITKPESASESHRVPQMLPDGERFLYYAMNAPKPGVYAFDPATKQSRLVVESETEAMFVEPSSLVFARDENVLLQRFDLQRMEVTGSPKAIAANVHWDLNRVSLNLGISPNGPLVYELAADSSTYKLAWMDRKGVKTPIAVEPLAIRDRSVTISADAKRAGFNVQGSRNSEGLALVDLERGVVTRLGDPRARFYYGALLSPDGRSIITTDANSHMQSLASFPTGGGAPTRILEGMAGIELGAWAFSPDSRTLIIGAVPLENKIGDLMTLDLEKGGPPQTLMATPEAEWGASLAPSGTALAYIVAGETERGARLMVVAYATPSTPVQVAPTRISGRFGWLAPNELAWMDLARKTWSATVTIKDGQIDVGAPKPLLDGVALEPNVDIMAIDAPRERFLVAIDHQLREDPRLVIVSDWRPEALAPTEARR
jgi:Tol biopolymer transport system component